MLRRCGPWLTLVLVGCTSVPAPAPPLPVVQAEAEPAYRSIVAQHLDTLFSKDAEMRGVSISGLRRVETGLNRDWMVCLRGTANSVAGGSSMRTYAIFINKRSEIVDRRLAEPADGCDQERFEPLGRIAK